jgi:hypothetical protein
MGVDFHYCMYCEQCLYDYSYAIYYGEARVCRDCLQEIPDALVDVTIEENDEFKEITITAQELFEDEERYGQNGVMIHSEIMLKRVPELVKDYLEITKQKLVPTTEND